MKTPNIQGEALHTIFILFCFGKFSRQEISAPVKLLLGGMAWRVLYLVLLHS